MATPANLEQLRDADLAVDVAVAPSDLLVVVRGEPDACDKAIAMVGTMRPPPLRVEMLKHSGCRSPASRWDSRMPMTRTSR